MASATATATMAAAGFDKRHSTSSSLQTPGSGTFPSELISPMASSPGGFLRKDDLKTPITPPSAYLDFLNKMSPAMMSPAISSTSSRFNFGDKLFDKPLDSAKSSITPPPSSHPPLSRNTSHDSNVSQTSNVSTASNASSRRPESPRIIIPPSPFVKPAPRSARTPRRLHIPQSPAFSPAMGSAHSVPSPYSATPLSAAPWSASFSPRDYDPSKAMEKAGKVSVRQVVTRTVTYCRTPLEPAPKGKRRKLDIEELDSSKETSVEPLVKHERIEEEPESTASTPPATTTVTYTTIPVATPSLPPPTVTDENEVTELAKES